VTYSYATGWGRDAGVVIIEHTLADGTIFFSHYGHITESSSFPFPSRLSCVRMGDVIGVIADVRPAPHLHFEIRSQTAGAGIEPGAGYSSESPYLEGYRQPSKFIINHQAWLSIWHSWHQTVGSETALDERGPSAALLPLLDESVLYLDGAGLTLRRATPDGRVLWRARLEKQAVSITAWQGVSLLTYADGTMQGVDVEAGSLAEAWRIEAQFTGAPLILGNELLFPAINNELLRISANRREIVSRIPNIPPFLRAQVLSNGSMAFISAENHLTYLAADSSIIQEADLLEMGSLAESWEGSLLAYTRGGLWEVGADWSLYIEDAPLGGESGAVLVSGDTLYLFNGQRLYAYNRDRALLWEEALPPVSGLVEIHAYEDIVLLTSNHGDIVAVNAAGGYCNYGRIFGRDRARQWQALGTDGILRIAIADQILGINWATFTRNCRV
jgi:outer membrane protein assembly factor BamB